MTLQSGKNRVTFQSGGSTLIGNLYCPSDWDASKKYPTLVVSGPLGTVKEQVSGRFSQKLAEHGFVALAFDFRTQGESEGEPKNYDNPFNKGEDIQNAISFLGALGITDKIGVLGVCAGATYSVHGIVSDLRVKAFATLVAHFSLREFTGYNPLVTAEIRTMLLNQSNEARQKFYETGISEPTNIIYPDISSKEELPFPGGDAEDIYDYYYQRGENTCPGFSKKMAAMSYEAHIKSDALSHAKDISVPYMGIVGSEAFSRPYTERFMNEILHDNKEIKVIEDARHVQAYDCEEYIDNALEYLSSFFNRYL